MFKDFKAAKDVSQVDQSVQESRARIALSELREALKDATGFDDPSKILGMGYAFVCDKDSSLTKCPTVDIGTIVAIESELGKPGECESIIYFYTSHQKPHCENVLTYHVEQNEWFMEAYQVNSNTGAVKTMSNPGLVKFFSCRAKEDQ